MPWLNWSVQTKLLNNTMPLIKSSSNQARGKNIATEIRSGKKPAQAAAIAYSVQREARASKTKSTAAKAKGKKK
jgi:hypothetical protein